MYLNYNVKFDLELKEKGFNHGNSKLTFIFSVLTLPWVGCPVCCSWNRSVLTHQAHPNTCLSGSSETRNTVKHVHTPACNQSEQKGINGAKPGQYHL